MDRGSKSRGVEVADRGSSRRWVEGLSGIKSRGVEVASGSINNPDFTAASFRVESKGETGLLLGTLGMRNKLRSADAVFSIK